MSGGVVGVNCRGQAVKNAMCWWAYARFILMCVYVGEDSQRKKEKKEKGSEAVAQARRKVILNKCWIYYIFVSGRGPVKCWERKSPLKKKINFYFLEPVSNDSRFSIGGTGLLDLSVAFSPNAQLMFN